MDLVVQGVTITTKVLTSIMDDTEIQRLITIIPLPSSNDYTTKMYESLKVVSYNCRGFPKSPDKLVTKPTIKCLLEDINIDIICFQETFLSKQDLSCLNVVHIQK